MGHPRWPGVRAIVADALLAGALFLRMEELLEISADLAREGRTLPNGMPLPLDLALFLREFHRELRVPLIPTSLVQAALAPLAGAAERRGLGLRYARRPVAA
jgi:hypothetical protein